MHRAVPPARIPCDRRRHGRDRRRSGRRRESPVDGARAAGAAALAAELLEGPENARLREPVGPGVFRVASGVDLAAVIVLGPWRGALVAGAAAAVARLVRASWRPAAFESSAFALAALAAGYAFDLGGGHTGRLTLPEDLVPLTALALVYLLVSRGLLELVGGGEAFRLDLRAAARGPRPPTRPPPPPRRPPREPLPPLEPSANIVEEGVPSPYRHSIRV